MGRSNIDYIVAGLGNVGDNYNMTRHNIGFMVIDYISQKWNFSLNKKAFKSMVREENILGKNMLFMKPNTYMNNSGQAIVEAVNFYKIDLRNVIIIYDDISLNLGKIKIKMQGSAGGHNGIKSIINFVCDDNFLRIKIGISNKPDSECILADWVLSKFRSDEIEVLNKVIRLSAEVLESIIKDGVNKAMNQYNKKTL